MTANTDDLKRGLDPKRAERVALLGLLLQGTASILSLILISFSGSVTFRTLAVQAGIGVLFWTVSWMHLRLRRAADEEARDLQEAERRRRQQGVEALFADEEQGPATRGLAHMDRFAAPAISGAVALLLLIPLAFFIYSVAQRGSLFDAITDLPPLTVDNVILTMAFAGSMAFGALLIGAYAAGLSRTTHTSLLRAGAGYILSTALFLGLGALAMGLASKGWIDEWPDRIVAGLLLLWMTLQAIEIIINMILDFYRPRVAGVEARPAYDSRLSGLLAEPQGLFHTFAHTMDYQFGFKVSDTWFFRFLEKAFAPLILIQLLTLYLLTCCIVVNPGEVAIIETWGAPRGVDRLPANDADWDALAEPKGPGLHFKWPWPVETARIIEKDRVQTLLVGFKAKSEQEVREKADKLLDKVISWDAEHIEDELKYLMPLPEDMQQNPSLAQERTTEAPAPGQPTIRVQRVNNRPDNALYLSGLFTVEYAIGNDRGDVYRYAYNYLHDRRTDASRAIMRALFERELTAFLAGARFWDLMNGLDREATSKIRNALQQAADRQRMGLSIITVNMQNVHPPVGEVGKAFQEVLSARQGRQAAIYDAEIEEKKILGMVPAQEREILAEAEAYKYRAQTVSRAEAKRFESQMAAQAAAPKVYEMRLRLQAIEEGVAHAPLVIHPAGIEVRIDRSKLPTLEEMEIQKGIMKQAENP